MEYWKKGKCYWKKLIENENNIKNENVGKKKILDQNINVIVNNSLSTNNIKLAGLYDPAENGLAIDMWSNSNGEEIKYILEKLSSKKLSNRMKRVNIRKKSIPFKN